jgi:O-antigen ligase
MRTDAARIALVAALFCAVFLLPENLARIAGYVLPAFLIDWRFLWQRRRDHLANPLMVPVLAFLGYVALSALWSGRSLGYFAETVGKTANILLFVLAMAHWSVFRNRSTAAAVVATALVTVAVLAPWAVHWHAVHPLPYRFGAFGVTANPILAALGLGALLIVVVGFAVPGRAGAGAARGFPPPALLAALGLLLFALMAFTQSRGPLLSLAATAVLWAVLHSRRRYQLMVLAVVVVAAAFLYNLFDLSVRGTSYRTEIWPVAVSRFLAAPLFGLGLGGDSPYVMSDGMVLHFPHNMLLSIAVQGGAVALALFALAVRAVFVEARRALAAGCAVPALLLVFGLVSGMTDRMIEPRNLSVEYLTIWLPVGILLAGLLQRQAVASATAAERPRAA